ncbi:hypothetical protein, conserved, partial [Trypanosoma cruzi]
LIPFPIEKNPVPHKKHIPFRFSSLGFHSSVTQVHSAGAFIFVGKTVPHMRLQ